MKKSKLGNKYLRERMNEAKSLRNEQRNLCVSILPKNKRDYFGNLHKKIVTNNRNFWKTISPLFSEKAFHRECITLKESSKTTTNNEKAFHRECITLKESSKTITNNEKLAETFNTF